MYVATGYVIVGFRIAENLIYVGRTVGFRLIAVRYNWPVRDFAGLNRCVMLRGLKHVNAPVTQRSLGMS